MLKYLADKLLKRQRINGDTGIYKFAQGWKRVSRIVLVNHLIKIHSYKSYLEIGPGHGLYLSKIFMSESIKNIEAWDISSESLKLTNEITKKK